MSTKESPDAPLAKVLVVDDEPLSLNAVSRMLRGHYDVLTASNGTLALEIATSVAKPELILLDLIMPELSGFAVLGRLKENPLTRNIPVIFVTALDTCDSQAQGLLAGAADFIVKPYTAEIFLARIATHLALTKVSTELAIRKDYIEEEVERRVRELMQSKLTADDGNRTEDFHVDDLALERNAHRIPTDKSHRIDAGERVSPKFAQLVWHADYECGNTAIDAQHRALVDVANELVTAMLCERPAQEIEQMIDALMVDVVQHFKDEEAAISVTRFPFAVEHAAIHRELEEMSRVLVESFHAGTLTIGVLFQFLAHELIGRHILGADRKFFSYLAMVA